MGYPPEPPPGLSLLEERHRLQRLAHSIGYVALPEATWNETCRLLERLAQYTTHYPTQLDAHMFQGELTEANERIRQERE